MINTHKIESTMVVKLTKYSKKEVLDIKHKTKVNAPKTKINLKNLGKIVLKNILDCFLSKDLNAVVATITDW